jgi:hypothetical protein
VNAGKAKSIKVIHKFSPAIRHSKKGCLFLREMHKLSTRRFTLMVLMARSFFFRRTLMTALAR